jgi:hypothetical protein
MPTCAVNAERCLRPKTTRFFVVRATAGSDQKRMVQRLKYYEHVKTRRVQNAMEAVDRHTFLFLTAVYNERIYDTVCSSRRSHISFTLATILYMKCSLLSSCEYLQ